MKEGNADWRLPTAAQFDLVWCLKLSGKKKLIRLGGVCRLKATLKNSRRQATICKEKVLWHLRKWLLLYENVTASGSGRESGQKKDLGFFFFFTGIVKETQLFNLERNNDLVLNKMGISGINSCLNLSLLYNFSINIIVDYTRYSMLNSASTLQINIYILILIWNIKPFFLMSHKQ